MIRPPPQPPLFPYTTLFRSAAASIEEVLGWLKTSRVMIYPYAHLSTDLAGREPAISTLKIRDRSEEHTSELQSHSDLVCRLLLEKKKLPEQFVHVRLHVADQ